MNYRFSGHETFPCRYAWIPKAVKLIKKDSKALSDDELSIVELGVGRNMVKAMRFWVQAMGIAHVDLKKGYSITDFGEFIFGDEGADRFLEDRRTLWLLHWNLLAHTEAPLFAWDFLFNRWNQSNIARAEVLKAFEREVVRLERILSPVTLEQHFNVFLHTYVPTQGNKGKVQEDNLDCPLIELELIQPLGQKYSIEGAERFETIYSFQRDSKPDITDELFIYCLFEYWKRVKPNESELSFRDVFVAPNCLGQAFKLQEGDIRERLYGIKEASSGLFQYQESAISQKVVCSRLEGVNGKDLLTNVFDGYHQEMDRDPPKSSRSQFNLARAV